VEEWENDLVCVANDRIFCAEIGSSGKICGRRLRLNETPRRLLYYEPLGAFIVACVKSAGRDYDGNKKFFSSLKIVDPKTFATLIVPRTLKIETDGESRGESLLDGEMRDSAKGHLIFSEPNEQIFCLSGTIQFLWVSMLQKSDNRVTRMEYGD
jgi:hypothetical protein